MAKNKPEPEDSGGGLSVSDALKMYEQYKSYWQDNYDEARTDLNFYLGIDQWDEKDVAARTAAGKASLVINELPQYVHQVTNDIRQNVPSIKVLPVSDGDIETGEIYSGLFRAIEDHSHADEVCDTASEYAVKCGIGFMRLDHDYCDEESEEQEITFKTVPDPLSVWLDPASVEYDGRDANGAIALEPINKRDFEQLYPDKLFSSFVDPKEDASKKDSIVLAEIFVREFVGNRRKKAIIRRYKFSGEDLLAETTFPGNYIPVVPIYGEVTWVDGKRKVSSLIRQARDPQRRLNHWASKESEILSMAPIAPVMAAEGSLVNDRGQWQKPGSEMVLEYKTTDIEGNPAPQPTRLAPPPVPTGIINAMEGAKEAIKESMGIYNAGLGKREGDASGIALQQLDRSGDVATFHFPDNVRRSYGHMGEIAIDMMPIIYDTPRIVQTLNDETDVVMVGINGAPMQGGQKQKYDLTKGKYRVRITTGASFTTRRQEESNFLQQAFKADPNLMQIGGDILFKSMDSPGAQAMAARFKKTLPPQLLDDTTDPQTQALMQQIQKLQGVIQQGTQEMQQMQAELKSKQADDQAKLMTAEAKLQEAKVKTVEVLKPEQAKMVTQDNDMNPTDPNAIDQQIQALLQQKADAETKQQNDALALQQQQQAAQDKENQETAMKEADMQQRAAQTQAIMQGISVIAQQLQALTAQVSKEPMVVRDANGAVAGIKYVNNTTH